MDIDHFTLTNMLPEEIILRGNVMHPCSYPGWCIQTQSAIIVLKYCVVHDGGLFKVQIQLGTNLLDKSP